MIIRDDFQQNTEEWHDFRVGKITGTRLKDMWSSRDYTKENLLDAFTTLGIDFPKKVDRKGVETDQPAETVADLKKRLTPEARMYLWSKAEKKMGFYELAADLLGLARDDENRMDRGLRLEEEASLEFEAAYPGKKLIQAGCCVSDVDERIINSPDRLIKPKKGKPVTEMVEIKCLSPARHLQAVWENRVPDEFESQKIQYFVVNEKLETLYFVFYDPSITAKPFYVIEVTRESLGNKPQEYLEFQLAQLKDLDRLVEELSF